MSSGAVGNGIWLGFCFVLVWCLCYYIIILYYTLLLLYIILLYPYLYSLLILSSSVLLPISSFFPNTLPLLFSSSSFQSSIYLLFFLPFLFLPLSPPNPDLSVNSKYTCRHFLTVIYILFRCFQSSRTFDPACFIGVDG